MRFAPALTAGLAATLVTASLHAQAPAPAPAAGPKNLMGNGGFEASFRRENLWDGTDTAGYLAGERGAVPVLTQSGSISETGMPISVSVADMNGDNLPDIVSLDVLGYLRIFFNSGTPQEAKFTIGELAGIFLTRTYGKDPILAGTGNAADQARLAGRVAATDILRSGKKDLVIGNYIGEVLMVPNAGSARTPDFRQPPDVSRLAIPTMKDPTRKWGNVFAPVTWDWNRDGKEDLLLGEGSYSANNIHLLLNMGAGSKPAFDETNRHVIAFGDGLEQLTPTVVDYNGDGLPDLLVSERSGKIAVYLNSGKTAKLGEPPPELPFASFVSGGSASTPLSVSGICTVSTGDFNGDGLFDLVVGKSNGRIALALNTGTKTEPKFATPVDLKGTTGTPPLAMPSGWDADYGLNRGNFYGFFSVVKVEEDKNAAPFEGKAVLKASYMPSPNTIMPKPTTYTGAFPDWNPAGGVLRAGGLQNAPAKVFSLRQSDRIRLKPNANYTLSFRVKGNPTEGQAAIRWSASKRLSEDRVTAGDRGSAQVQRNEAREESAEELKFSGGSNWMEVKKDFKAVIRNRDLLDVKDMGADLTLLFTVPEGGAVYFDDFKVVERP